MERERTPLQEWLDAQGIGNDYERAAALCRRLGRKVAAAYLEQIARGYYRPGGDLSLFLSRRLTRGAVSVDQLLSYPYTRGARKCTTKDAA